jgi:3-hydroxyisobutyrate dehydrogenase-like beta-hydroxyacid dehydrogenase
MSQLNIGVLHPGAMGVSLAAAARNSGHRVFWASAGRSEQTRQRADENDLQDAGTLGELVDTCGAIVSICPPHAAEAVAGQVLECGFGGAYLDANAISPERAMRIGERMAEAGADFIDGSVIGGPAWDPGTTTLYLSGADAENAAGWFSAGPVATRILGTSVGRASGLKMCYAAYSKGSTALLCAVLAAAESLGVRGELEEEWDSDGDDFSDQARRRVRRVTQKAWRFAGEMKEIESTFISTGLPPGFHSASSVIYDRISHFKDREQLPALEEALLSLIS